MAVIPFHFEKLPLEGAFLIDSFYASDVRGGFCKDYSRETFSQNGIDYELKEVFYTYSHKGVIRALHFQQVKQQPKLVRCVHGHVYDVIVDLRKDSDTYKRWLGFNLTGDNHRELLVPAGFAHGYLVLSDDSIVSYKCAEKFYSEYDSGIMWNDPDIGVKWPLDELGGTPIILAEKDKTLPSFKTWAKIHLKND
jgi:dTDP-4-dehydrorhamnose 3,5-epimerase